MSIENDNCLNVLAVLFCHISSGLPDPIQAMSAMVQMSEKDPFERARWLAEEVPCHFAHRMCLLDRLDVALDSSAKASTMPV